MPCSNQAASGPLLPKDISGLTHTSVCYRQIWGKTYPKTQDPSFLHPTPPVWSDAGLKVPVLMGQRKGGHYPCTWILPLSGHHQAPEASLFLCPHFPGLWGFTKHPGEEAIKPQTQVLWPVPSTLLRRSQTEQGTPSQPRNTPSVDLGRACSSTFGCPKPGVLPARP